MFTNDWKIHKKLLEAGGKGSVIYYIPARGGGKMDDISRLLAEDRTVVYVRPRENRTIVFDSWNDLDILTPERYERAERILNEYWKGKRDEKEM